MTLPREPTFHSFVPRNPSSDQQQSSVETVETVSPLPQSPSKRTMGTYINCSQPRFRPPPRTGGNAFQRYTWRLRTIGTMPQHNNCHRPVIAEQHSTSDSKPRQALERLKRERLEHLLGPPSESPTFKCQASLGSLLILDPDLTSYYGDSP